MDQQEQNKPEPSIEDLTVSEAGAAEVKAGAQVDFFLKLQGVDGEATDARGTGGYIQGTNAKL